MTHTDISCLRVTTCFHSGGAKKGEGKIPIKLGMLYLAAKTKTWDPALLELVNYSNTPLYKRKPTYR